MVVNARIPLSVLQRPFLAQWAALAPNFLPLDLADYRQRIGLYGWNIFWPFQGTVAAVVFILSNGSIG